MPLPAALHALPDEPLVLAVSGGRDSMALLEAAARVVAGRVVAVAAFDHGTGPHATEAVRLVAARRVKRFFADARIPGMDRAGWPVVLAAGEIIWIPGVRRADAATDRSGGPGVRYVCERISSD